jgi:hypothetical protein
LGWTGEAGVQKKGSRGCLLPLRLRGCSIRLGDLACALGGEAGALSALAGLSATPGASAFAAAPLPLPPSVSALALPWLERPLA